MESQNKPPEAKPEEEEHNKEPHSHTMVELRQVALQLIQQLHEGCPFLTYADVSGIANIMQVWASSHMVLATLESRAASQMFDMIDPKSLPQA